MVKGPHLKERSDDVVAGLSLYERGEDLGLQCLLVAHPTGCHLAYALIMLPTRKMSAIITLPLG